MRSERNCNVEARIGCCISHAIKDAGSTRGQGFIQGFGRSLLEIV